ncbi:ADP-ribosylation factor-like protein 13A isoform X2 [Nerophis ophidion]|uniref:ADP-ribosylation factor-like protein 13A isoform X2 n=1 Tax=Nerophis ophidion TaxID=159077 RepID=UPI002AE0041D|nr:ADP-ribosylation factor-like protein 13A isoform X2 [Nerophis ophidion]
MHATTSTSLPPAENMVAWVLTSPQHVQPDEQLLHLVLQVPGTNQASDPSCGGSGQGGKDLLHPRDAQRCQTIHVSLAMLDWNITCPSSLVPHAVEGGPTQGCVRNQTRVENYLVTLLDVGGSVGAWGDFYGEAHGIIFVVDSSDRPRIKEVKEVLADLLKQPRVAGKPILVLANKQDKMRALLGSDLTEMLSLEKLVNQSRSLCHIEPCSALMDIRRRADRKTLRGLRWLVRAISLDYLQLTTRLVQDSKSPPGPPERSGRAERTASRTKRERLRGSQTDMKTKDKAKRTKGEMLQKEQTLKKKMKKSARRKKSSVGGNEDQAKEQNEEEEEEDNVDHLLLPSCKSRPKGKTKVKEETLEVPEWTLEDHKLLRAPGRMSEAKKKKKKKKTKVKKKSKNKINTEDMSQHVHLPATLDLYRKAILALKERQAEGQ